MKLCFSTLGCPEWNWGEIVATATDLGFEGIELRGVQNETYVPRIREMRPENIEATKLQLARLGLFVPCITSGFTMMHNDDISELKEYVDLAHKLGASYVRVLASEAIVPGAEDVDDQKIVDLAAQAGAYAKNKDVVVLIETNGAYADTQRLARVLDQIHSPAVAALWDVHHPFRFLKETPKDTVDNLGTYIKHVHCKDSVMHDDKVCYRIMGQGDVPVRNAVLCLNDIGYQGFYSLEWVKRWDLTLEEPGIAFVQYIRYMRG